ncbi:Gfo/Idh/MocA family protein [Acidisoma sp. C75]
MSERVGIGIIGCGTISAAYLKAARGFPILDILGLADAVPEAAERRAAEFGHRAMSVEQMLQDPAIEIVVNLTIPRVHVAVGLQILAAGKHAYSEKPLGITTAEARQLLQAAEARGLRLGSAPDTFLGGAHQTCRKLVDAGVIGQPVAGTAFFMCPGHERWHPAPAFYYEKGGGPMLDMGPYYITDLVNLLGPVAQVAGMGSRLRAERTITSAPLSGTKIPVDVPTHMAGTLLFAGGAIVSIAMSFDVAKHRHQPLELYGTEGSLLVPDPNFFGGEIRRARPGGMWRRVKTEHAYADGNYRILGVAEMAQAIRAGRPHRASGELAYHVLEVMEAIGRSSEDGAFITIESRPQRPEPMAVAGL